MKRFAFVAWGLAAVLALSACEQGDRLNEDDARAAMDTANDINDRLESGGDVSRLEVDESQGPAARVMAESYNIMMRDDRRFMEQATQAGMIRFLEFQDITPSSPVLRRCDAIAALEAEADENATHFSERADQIEAMARGIIENANDYEQFLSGFRGGRTEAARRYRRNWELNADIAAAAGDMCRVLARGNWRPDGGSPMFTDNSDLAEFNRHASRLSAAQTELDQAIRAAAAQSRANAQNLEQNLR